MSMSPALGVAIGAPVAALAPAANPNLLKWTEEFDNPAWIDGGVAVTPNAALNPAGTEATADRAVLDAEGAISQSSTTAAAAGATATAGLTLTTSWVRYEVTGTFDGLPYTFSIYLKGNVGNEIVAMRIARAGGVLQVILIEDGGVGCTAFLWGAQLEQAASASIYQARTT